MGISPFVEITLLEFSSFPTGTSIKDKLGIDASMLSSSFLILAWSLTYFEICSEIFFDFSNKEGSLFLDITFFSFSRVSLS
ncbi:uncharacterized protein METZ01_LOCUS112882 [marine metagenome]|uniref:Uncharacterized protein n=1 Tax=marine metagenome TaxID=408172 RepID=A0A381X5T6_9ZZZZ